MDNVTHTLIGVLVGECAARALPASSDGLPAQTRRNLFVTGMAVGSNLQDLDFLYSMMTGGKLDYLLQHRGHTHTIIGSLATAAVLLIAMDVWLRWRRLTPSREAPAVLACAFAALVALLLAVSRRAAPHVALTCGVLVWFGATAMFLAASRLAGARMESLAAHRFPEAALHDHVLTPMPVNPLCWEVILVQGAGDDIVLRQAMLSLAPSWIPVNECLSRGLGAEATAPVQPAPIANDREIAWRGQVVSSRSRLAGLIASDCRAAAFMRFARAPWLAVVADALVIGDLRYDRETDLGFAEIDLSELRMQRP